MSYRITSFTEGSVIITELSLRIMFSVIYDITPLSLTPSIKIPSYSVISILGILQSLIMLISVSDISSFEPGWCNVVYNCLNLY